MGSALAKRALRNFQRRRFPSVRRAGGSRLGRIGSWMPQRVSMAGQRDEREVLQGRSEDLVNNDWAARSVVDSMTSNVVGTGLKPHSRPLAARLGISKEIARYVATQMEEVWGIWQMEAHPSGKMSFDDLCFLGLRNVLVHGELLHLPVMLPEQGRTFSLAIQDIHPGRLRTPLDFGSNPAIREGIEFNAWGVPQGYYIADPPASAVDNLGLLSTHALPAGHYVRKPAFLGHRPCVLHLFRAEEVEQVRGVTTLAAGMKLFRHLDDSLDYELMAQIVAASIPMFIETQDPQGAIRAELERKGQYGNDEESWDPHYHQIMRPGTIMYGNPGERPHPITSDRPGANFVPFTELILRAAAASTGMPYEVLAKDFSKTNYSSARAALLEAWRVFMVYRTWLVNHYCTTVWRMVQEEAVLRGLVKLPKSAAGFYDALHAWTAAKWIGPARGNVDPLKEIMATVRALENNLTNHADAIAERGDDWEDVWDQRATENNHPLIKQTEEDSGV